MTSLPAEGPVPHGAGPLPHDLWWQDVTPYGYPPAGEVLARLRMRAHADLIADELSSMLPDGYSLGYEPSLLIVDEVSISDAELDEIARRWRKAMEHPRDIRVWPPLPRRVRLKLAAQRAFTMYVIMPLANHGHDRAALLVHRLAGVIGL